MIFTIRYFRDATCLGDVAWNDAKGDPMASARAGVIGRQATHAVILDDQGNELALVHSKEP